MIVVLEIIMIVCIALAAIANAYRAYKAYRARASRWKIFAWGSGFLFLGYVAISQFWLEETAVDVVARLF
jgi:hypothetical protein